MRLLYPTSRNLKFLFLFIAAAVLIIAVSAIGARTWYTPTAKHSLAPPALARPLQAGQVGSELITCTARGFEPTQITRPAGKFLLTVNNSSELRTLTLRLVNGSGQILREKQLAAGKLNWRELLDLESGSYTITEANHPDWVFHLTLSN